MSEEKKSYGSCRAAYSRREDEHQYLDVSANEAARLIIALQNVVGTVIASERRGSESDVRLWIHSPSDESVTVTAYRKGD